MKAAVLNQIGDDKLELCDDVSTVDPGPGEVRFSGVLTARRTSVATTTACCHSGGPRLDLEEMVSRPLSLDEINDGMRVLQSGAVVRQVVIFD